MQAPRSRTSCYAWSPAVLVLDREARGRRRPARRVLAQQDDAVAILEGDRGHRLTVVDYGVLRALDLDVRGLQRHRLRTVALGIDEHNAVVEVAAPDALLPGGGGLGQAGTELLIELVEPHHAVVLPGVVGKAVVAVVHQTGAQAIAHTLVIGRGAPLVEYDQLRRRHRTDDLAVSGERRGPAAPGLHR